MEYASLSWASLSATLSEDIESLQRRALRIIYPDLSYMDALFVSGRHECCMKFISKVRECKSDNNPLVNISLKKLHMILFMIIIFGITILKNYLTRRQNDSRDLL